MLAIWNFAHVLTAAVYIAWWGLKVRMEKFAKWWRHTLELYLYRSINFRKKIEICIMNFPTTRIQTYITERFVTVKRLIITVAPRVSKVRSSYEHYKHDLQKMPTQSWARRSLLHPLQPSAQTWQQLWVAPGALASGFVVCWSYHHLLDPPTSHHVAPAACRTTESLSRSVTASTGWTTH